VRFFVRRFNHVVLLVVINYLLQLPVGTIMAHRFIGYEPYKGELLDVTKVH
jgi:hypothetical protein